MRALSRLKPDPCQFHASILVAMLQGNREQQWAARVGMQGISMANGSVKMSAVGPSNVKLSFRSLVQQI
eukprot:4396331-Amphidinium_carterae.1